MAQLIRRSAGSPFYNASSQFPVIATNTGWTPGSGYSPQVGNAVSQHVPTLNVGAMARMTAAQRAGMSPLSQAAYAATEREAYNRSIAKPKSFNWFQMDSTDQNSPFSNTRYNMLGGMETISRSDPRHTSTAYASRFPGHYSDYQAGRTSGNQLFSRSMRDSVRNDSDELNTDAYKHFGHAPKVTVRFSSGGGTSYFGTGISIGGLSGRKFW